MQSCNGKTRNKQSRDDLRVIVTSNDLRMTYGIYGQYISNLVIRLSSNQV
jgi:hypothetical protein